MADTDTTTDSLTAAERDVVETLARDDVEADVVLSLPAEPGRAALAAGAGLVAELDAIARLYRRISSSARE